MILMPLFLSVVCHHCKLCFISLSQVQWRCQALTATSMLPSLQCLPCMWFWLCLFMWPGMKARLKGRANTIRAGPYQLVRLKGTGRQTQAKIHRPPAWALAVNTAPSTNQKVSRSGLGLGFNLRLKHETVTVFSPSWGEWRLLGVFFFFPTGSLFDFLFSENITFAYWGQTPF